MRRDRASSTQGPGSVAALASWLTSATWAEAGSAAHDTASGVAAVARYRKPGVSAGAPPSALRLGSTRVQAERLRISGPAPVVSSSASDTPVALVMASPRSQQLWLGDVSGLKVSGAT